MGSVFDLFGTLNFLRLWIVSTPSNTAGISIRSLALGIDEIFVT